MVEYFPATESQSIDGLPLSVGKNYAVFKDPYSKEYIPNGSVMVFVTGDDVDICFDSKHFAEFLDYSKRLSNEDKLDSPKMSYIKKSDGSCLCCSTGGWGLFIEMEYQFSCTIDSRCEQLPPEEKMVSQKDSKDVFLCMDCLEHIRENFPEDQIRSIIASYTV